VIYFHSDCIITSTNFIVINTKLGLTQLRLGSPILGALTPYEGLIQLGIYMFNPVILKLVSFYFSKLVTVVVNLS